MSPRRYLARVAPEFALLVVAVTCLATVVLQGFVVAPSLQFNVALTAGLSCLLQAVLFAAAYRRRNAVWGVLGYLALSAAIVAVGLATSAGTDPLADTEGNNLAYCAVLVVANLLAFALSRTPGGMLALVAAGLFSCAFVQYVYHADLVAPTVAFAACLVALYAVRAYARGVHAADVPAKPAHLQAAAAGVAVAAVALGLSWAVWALVVAPLNPGHVTVKLFTEYRAFETVEVENPVDVQRVENPDETTVTLTDETVYGDIPVQIDGDDPALASIQDFVDDAREYAGEQDTFRMEADEDGVYLYTYAVPTFWWLLWLLVPVALVAGAVAARLWLRRRARARIAACAPREQVGRVYTALLRKLDRVGLGKPPAQTPAEFARAARARMDAFAAPLGAGPGWAEVSAAYERAHFGGAEPTDEELAACWRLYDGFAACTKKRVGRLKYWFRYFWTV